MVRADVKWRCARLELTFAGDKWEVGGWDTLRGWDGLREERDHGI